MDPVTAIAAAAASTLASTAGTEAWTAAVNRLRARTQAETGAPDTGTSEAPPEGTEAPAQAALSQLLESYYTKVGRRADVSFFAAIVAALLGYVIIAAGILVGIYRSDDLLLAVVVTSAGALSQVLSFFFFRNRAEERKMMIQVLADLREDAEQNARAVRALDLIEQVQQPLLRDNLTAAVALELSGAAADLKSIHASLKLFEANGDQNRPGSA
ncbi:TRADD-N-associated membrane domain-containing protein [Streptomyces rubiginosohelvolus]|uniref:TRADD-N-associated membrane domain-containing protein n=1 Tax=Streptomyces rubiginosohelvolus TaxID=67362 RepID=UPI0036684940